MDIFKKLLKREIPFAVGIDVSTFIVRTASVENKKLNYFIVCLKADMEHVADENFKESAGNRHLLEMNLTSSEVEDFKNEYFHLFERFQFKKSQHNEYGRIYELKSKPFKKYYDKHMESLKKKQKKTA